MPRQDRLASLRVGVGIISLVLGASVLHALRHILDPLLLAVFLLFTIGGLEKALGHWLPRRAALPAAILFVVGVFAASVYIVAANASQLVAASSGYVERLNRLLQIGSDRLGLHAAPTIDQLFHQINPGRYFGVVASGVGGGLETVIFVLIYLGFLIASRRSFRGKVDELFQAGQSEAATVFARIQRGVESYIWVQTVVGFMIAGASALIMWPMGIQHIWFWSFLIFIANYVPTIGGAVGVLLPAVYGLVELDALWKPLLLVVLLETVHFTVNHVDSAAPPGPEPQHRSPGGPALPGLLGRDLRPDRRLSLDAPDGDRHGGVRRVPLRAVDRRAPQRKRQALRQRLTLDCPISPRLYFKYRSYQPRIRSNMSRLKSARRGEWPSPG